MTREPALDSILRDQVRLHAKAKRLRVPIAVRRAMVETIDQCFRAVYKRRAQKKRKGVGRG